MSWQSRAAPPHGLPEWKVTGTVGVMVDDIAPLTSPEQAAAALADVQRGRDAAARRLPTPWWYHWLVGLALAVMVGSFALPQPDRQVVLGLSIGAQIALFRLFRRLTGVWFNAFEIPGMKRPAALATVVGVAFLLLALALEHYSALRGGAVVVGAVLGVAYVVYWRWVEREVVRLWRHGP